MIRRLPPLLLLLWGLVPSATARAELTDQQVRESLRRGVEFLQRQQDRTKGNWTEHPAQPGGLTALCTLALLNSGVPPQDPHVQRALTYLRQLGNPKMTYSTALQTMVYCAAEPEKDRLAIRQNVEWLEEIQVRNGERRGTWGYSSNHGNGDNSNTQFALMALHEAQRIGVKVQDATWQISLDYWRAIQKGDGSWGYHADEPATGSMTCAGLSALVMASGGLGAQDAAVVQGQVQCCLPPQGGEDVELALDWLGDKFSVTTNPSPFSGTAAGRSWLLYYLYGVERVGRLTGRRFIGQHDWYREGAAMLVAQQDSLSGFWQGEGHAESNRLVATSLALLFLSKGRRPVVIGRLELPEVQETWHRSSLRNLTWRIEQRWKRDLSWQTIELSRAALSDLLETPILYLSGRDAFTVAPEQRALLREYVQQGGFIFAEACCDGQEFDRSFRQLVKDMFPESALRLLPPDHAIWFADQPADPNFLRPLYGLEACCRTGIVYCPQNLSCLWELHQEGRELPYPPSVRDEIEACVRIGVNVATYATNRELKEKLDRPHVTRQDSSNGELTRGILYVPKLVYAGGGDEAPNALVNLLSLFRQQSQIRVSTDRRLIQALDKPLFDYPVLFMHGRRSFRFSPAEREALAEFFERGGVLIADAICGSQEFAEAFRREMKTILPSQELRRLPSDHALFTSQYHGFDLATVALRDPQLRRAHEGLQANVKQVPPFIEGLAIGDHLAVLFSPYDLSCALENATSVECQGYTKADAARLGINLLLFALQQ